MLKWCLTVIPFFVLTSTIITFVQHSQSAHFDVNYVSELFGGYGPNLRYELGTFDLETWVCDIAIFDKISPTGSLGFDAECVIETGTRWLLLIWVLISSMVAQLGWWLLQEEKLNIASALQLKSIMRAEYV
jgi:membrane-associated phospholipid phosphatase